MDLSPKIRVVFYPDQFLRNIGKSARSRTLAAGNCARRTQRLAQNQRAPILGKDRSGNPIYGASLPGEVPFRRRGTAYGHVGYDFRSGKSGSDHGATYLLFVENHGWETGHAKPDDSGGAAQGRLGGHGGHVRSGAFSGVKRPALRPMFAINRQLFIDIMLGKRTAPRYGDTSFVQHRQSLSVTEKINKRGKVTQTVRFRGPVTEGTFRRKAA